MAPPSKPRHGSQKVSWKDRSGKLVSDRLGDANFSFKTTHEVPIDNTFIFDHLHPTFRSVMAGFARQGPTLTPAAQHQGPRPRTGKVHSLCGVD